MKRIAVLLFTLALFACSTVPRTPQQTIYQATSDYNAAVTIALAYKALPPCPAATVLCSDPAIVAKLKQADAVAYAALVAAENTARSSGAGANAQTAVIAANQAIIALTAITAALAVK